MLHFTEELNKTHFKQLAIKLIVVSFTAFSLYSLVLLPLYITLDTNVLYQETTIAIIVYYLIKAVEMLGIIISTGIIIYSLYLIDLKRTAHLSLIFLAATIYKYTTNLLVTWIITGGIPTQFYKEINFVSTNVSIVLEAFMFFIIILVSYKKISKAINSYNLSQIAAKKAGIEGVDYHSKFFPFTKLFDLKNPLQFSAFICAAVFLIKSYLEWTSNFIYDWTNKVFGYNIINYISTYITEFIAAVIIYLLVIYVLVTLDSMTEKYLAKVKKADDENYLGNLK